MIEEFTAIAQKVGTLLQARGAMLATAESCTGGWVSSCLTSIPGSSLWFERGFVTYSNAAKAEMLGINADLIVREGAVSEAVALEMATGAIRHSHAKVSLAITGIAGPDGGTIDKPVGTVWFAFAGDFFDPCAISMQFDGDRRLVRKQSVHYSLEHLISML